MTTTTQDQTGAAPHAVPASAPVAPAVLQQLAVERFAVWLSCMPARPWWTIDADEPRITPWGAR